MLAHLAGCEDCGVTLRLAVEAIHGEDAVEKKLHQLPAPGEHALLAKKLAGEPERSASPKVVAMPAARPSQVSKWVLAAAAAAVIAVGAWWRMQPDVPVETLLAQAYTERRPTEFRIPGAGVAPIRMDRAAQATFERPAALLDAESRIAQGIKNKPGDSRWLQWKARAEMLEFRADEAIGTLTRALEAQPGDAELLAELGAAYAQRAEREDQAGAERSDWSNALDKLSLALRAQPALSLALYNRALVQEKLSMTTEAIADWERYLQLDGSGEWAAEARKRLATLEQKKNSVRTPQAPSATPNNLPGSN